MATEVASEYDFELSSDITSLATVEQSNIESMVKTLLPDPKHGGIVYGPNTPDVQSNPRYARYLWMKTNAVAATAKPEFNTYDPSTGKWGSATIGTATVTNAMLAGSITIDKFAHSNAADAGFVTVVTNDGKGFEVVAINNALLPTIDLEKLNADGAVGHGFLKRDVDNKQWEIKAFSASFIAADSLAGSAIAEESIPVGKYGPKSIKAADIDDLTITEAQIAAATLTRAKFASNELGKSLQLVYASFFTPVTVTSTLVNDNTVPNASADSLQAIGLSLSITPRFANSSIRIKAVVQVDYSVATAGSIGSITIHKDATGEALAMALTGSAGASDYSIPIVIDITIPAVDVSARTYNVYAARGDVGGTDAMKINFNLAGHTYGNSILSTLTVEEIAA